MSFVNKLKIGVLVSGRGSNLQAIIDACKDPSYPIEIACVISNNDNIEGIERARTVGIPTHVISNKDFPSRDEFDEAINTSLLDFGAEFVCLAGFMRILTSGFVKKWENKIINIHPSLLPAFKGAHPHDDVIRAGVEVSGCTVHFVTAEMDGGPIIMQEEVDVDEEDTAKTLAEKVLKKEHELLPLVLKLIAQKKVRIINGRVSIE